VRLAVVVSVDGLSMPQLQRYRAWFVGGLRRLLDEALVETRARYRHLNTETGPGHSALATGAPPRVTGVVGNRWFEQNPDGSIRSVNCVDTPAPDGALGDPPMFYRQVERDGRLYVFASSRGFEEWQTSGETGRGTIRFGYGPRGEAVVFDSDDAIALFNLRYGRSKERFVPRAYVPGPGNLRVPTLGDRLVETRPGSRVVALSGKDRSTVFLAGRHPRHAAYWFDQDSGRFVTSTYYDPPAAARAVVSAFNRTSAGATLPGRFGLFWKSLPQPAPGADPPQPRPTPVPAPELVDYQLPSNGLGWDHPLALQPRGYFAGLYVSPFVDDLVNGLALAFVEDPAFGLGRRGAPDLLALSYSAHDTVSHSYGAESEESLDVLRRLDLHLGRLIEALERALPKGSVMLALSADHGFPPIPEAERVRNPEFGGGRLVLTNRAVPSFLERLNRALSEELCLAPGSRPVFGVDGWTLIYNRPALPMRTVADRCGIAERLVTSADVDAALPTVTGRLFREEVEDVYLVSRRDRWPEDGPATEFVRNDFDPERSGDAFLIPRYGVMTHWDPARGAMHGSHHDYDTHVPLLFWGGPFRSRLSETEATPYDLAPTLAEVLGLTLPDAVGRSRAPGRP
jgi:predicted AlkP superfamily pyrophosphatase or phosphodiesterase